MNSISNQKKIGVGGWRVVGAVGGYLEAGVNEFKITKKIFYYESKFFFRWDG